MKAITKLNLIPPHRLALFSAVVCAGLVAFSQNASASRSPLPPSPAHLLAPNQFELGSPIGDPAHELNYLQTHGFLPATSQYLGKFNNEAPFVENGAITISQYVSITVVSGNTWDVSWNLTGSGFTLDGMLLKDGVASPQHQLYRFYGVSADEKLIGSGTVTFDDPVKGISHLTFFGSPGGAVPDGGTTVMLLGAALGVLGVARRYLMS